MSAVPVESIVVSPPRAPLHLASAQPRARGLRLALFALVALPVAAHLAFSSLGFNPTDDGFVHAYGRRLLDGQVPHLDFISIRPVGSALLHAPELLLGGSAVFWVGRLVAWFEVAWIAWSWAMVSRRLLGETRGPLGTLLAVVAGFVFTAGQFPTIPWHTIDALALASSGLWLATSASGRRRALGYSLMGAAALCRQNFLPVGVAAALVLRERLPVRMTLAWVAPLLLYALALLATGAMPDALLQLGAQTGVLEAGFRRYVTQPHVAAGLALGASTALAARRAGSAPWLGAVSRLAGTFLLVWAAWTLTQGDGSFARKASFVLFGVSLGLTLVGAWAGRVGEDQRRLGLLALVVAWCTSISIGLNTPALAAGALAVYVLGVSGAAPGTMLTPRASAFASATTMVLVLAIGGLWVYARYERIYRERPARELTYPLGRVLAGADHLRTNPKTYALLADLREAVALARGRPFALVADFACHWVRSPQGNPLSIDWPQGTELGRPELCARVIADLERLRGRGCILVQKHHTALVARAFFPTATTGDYFLVAHVRERFRKTGETAHFDLYE